MEVVLKLLRNGGHHSEDIPHMDGTDPVVDKRYRREMPSRRTSAYDSNFGITEIAHIIDPSMRNFEGTKFSFKRKIFATDDAYGQAIGTVVVTQSSQESGHPANVGGCLGMGL